MKTLKKPQYQSVAKQRVKNGLDVAPVKDSRAPFVATVKQDKYDLSVQGSNGRNEETLDVAIKSVEEMGKTELKSLKLVEKNDFQEGEAWVDKRDITKHPIYS